MKTDWNTYVDFKGIAMTIRDYARWQHELDQHELRARSELRNYFALLRKTYAENLRNAIILHELQREDDDYDLDAEMGRDIDEDRI